MTRTVTIDTTAAQERGLAYGCARFNPPATPGEYLVRRLGELLDADAAAATDDDERKAFEQFRDNYRTLSADDRASVTTAVGAVFAPFVPKPVSLAPSAGAEPVSESLPEQVR